MSEQEQIEAVLGAIDRPPFVTEIRHALDTDAAGEPAVWVWVVPVALRTISRQVGAGGARQNRGRMSLPADLLAQSPINEPGRGDSVKEIAQYWSDAGIDEIHRRVSEWTSKKGAVRAKAGEN